MVMLLLTAYHTAGENAMKITMKKLLTTQFLHQLLPQLLVAGLAQQREHVLLIRFHAGLVEGIHVQQIAAEEMCIRDSPGG